MAPGWFRRSNRETISGRAPVALLRHALFVDAGMEGAVGVAMAFGAGPLSRELGLDQGLVREAGIALIPFAGLLACLGTREPVDRSAMLAVIIGHLLWVLCLVLLVASVASPTPLGYGLVAARTVAIAATGTREWTALRRTQASA